MAASTPKVNKRLITGNLVQIAFKSNNSDEIHQNNKLVKIILKIDSCYTQIGNNNKIFASTDILTSLSRKEIEESSKDTLININDVIIENESGTHVVVRAKAVQVIADNNELEIILDSEKASSLQVGNKCQIYFSENEQRNDGQVEVNCEDDDSIVTHYEVKQQKERRKKRQKTTEPKQPENRRKEENIAVSIESLECIQLCDKFFEVVLRILHPLRDNGKWTEFDEKMDEFTEKYGSDPVWEILLILELGLRICYHSKFTKSHITEAENTLFRGRGLIRRLKGVDVSIKQFCEGRLNCYLTSLYRRTKKLGIAHKCLVSAERCFRDTCNENFVYDKAMLFYEKGSFFYEYDQKGVKNDETKKSFEKCYELSAKLNKQEGCEFVKKGHFAKLKKAMLLLGCSKKQGRKRRISDEDLAEANKCIDELAKENSERQDIPISEQLQYLIARSDSFTCSDDLIQAEELAHEAVALADEHGFDSRPAKKRLQDISNRKVGGEQRQIQRDSDKGRNRHAVEEYIAQGHSCDADGSSSQSAGNGSDGELRAGISGCVLRDY